MRKPGAFWPNARVTYADLTLADPNPIKRWLQRRRLVDALALGARAAPHARIILDYGAGDGALMALARARFPNAALHCFEPTPDLFAQCTARLGDAAHLHAREDTLPTRAFDLIFCTEVFEHLPPRETDIALGAIACALKPEGVALIGVPIETGPPALAKGLFRWTRRPAAPDGRWRAILAATFGAPQDERTLSEIAPGRAYHPFHIGFDHHAFARALAARFTIVARRGSPFRFAPAWANSELHFLAQRLSPDQ